MASDSTLTEMGSVTQQNVALVEEAARSLQEQADRLAQMAAVFKVEMPAVAASALAAPRKAVARVAAEQRLQAPAAKPNAAARAAVAQEWETF